MKTSLVAIASAILLTCSPAFAQSAPAPSADPAVVAATKQMLAAMKMHDTMVAAMRQVEQRMPAQMKASTAAAINANPKLDAQQKADALKKADDGIARAAAQMHTVLADPTLVDEILAEIVPLYAENYTLDEIRQMTAFYNSPVGQKMIVTMPALMGRSMEITNRVMMPRLQKVLAQAAAQPGASSAAGN